MAKHNEMTIIDWNGNVLTSNDVSELLKTVQGQQRLYQYIWGARAGFTAHELLTYLDELKILKRRLTMEEQHNICSVVYSCIYELDYTVVERWIRAAAEYANRSGLQPMQIRPRYDA